MNAVAQQMDFRTDRSFVVESADFHTDSQHASFADGGVAHDQAVGTSPQLSVVDGLAALSVDEEAVEEIDVIAADGLRAHQSALSLREAGRAAIIEAEAQAAANPQKTGLISKLRQKFAKH